MEESQYRVLNPRASAPESNVIPLAPRLPELRGKKVYFLVVLTNPLARQLMPEIMERLSDLVGNVRTIYREKQYVGYVDEPELWDEISAEADAVVVGLADSGGFAPACLQCMAIFEKRCIPTALVADKEFESVIQMAANAEGLPRFRKAFKHQFKPFTEKSMAELINALTVPLTEEEKKSGVFRPAPLEPRFAIIARNREELQTKYGVLSVQDYFEIQGYTDGLPIVVPTEELVDVFLKHTSHARDEVIGILEPGKLEVTVEKAAINAVMAGCKPEYLPVLLAMAEAVMKNGMLEAGRATTSWAFPIIVNGPIAEEIGMNSGINALGPGNRANASIGRALSLFKVNLAGLWPGKNDMSCIGNPLKYCICFAENEKKSPWEPLHMDLGFHRKDSTVTVFIGGRSFMSVGGAFGHAIDRGLEEPEATLFEISHQMRAMIHPFAALILLDPLVARFLEKHDFTKDSLKQWLWENTKVTMTQFKQSWGYSMFIPAAIRQGGKPSRPMWPKSYLELPDDAIVNLYPAPESIHVVVVGGSSNPDYDTFDVGGASHQTICSTASIDKWR